MEININGLKITLTKNQLEEIDRQVKRSKTIFERVQDIQDVYNELGNEFIINIPYKSPKTLEEKSANAFVKLLMIVKVYNEDAILDWKNPNQYKYIPYKYFGSGVAHVGVYGWDYCFFCTGLYFKDEKTAKDALSKFRDIYEDFWMLS